jgi:hypothetical protein
MIIKIDHLFKHNSFGKAIPELADQHFAWVINGLGIETYKLRGELCRIVGTDAATWACRKWDPVTEEFITIDPVLDKPLLRAFFNLPDRETEEGFFVAYGEGIRGNPYMMDHPEMISVCPPHHDVWMPVGKVRKAINNTVKEIFDMCKRELLDPLSNVDGVVFHKMVDGNSQMVCQVERDEF